MEFCVSRKGAAVVSLWFAAAGAVVSIPFWRAFWLETLGALIVYWILCLWLLTVRLASCKVRAGAHHLTVRRGVLFLTTRRLPLRWIAGCHILRTPLQRHTGTCLLVLYASGSITVVAGAPYAKAEQLSALLAQGGARP